MGANNSPAYDSSVTGALQHFIAHNFIAKRLGHLTIFFLGLSIKHCSESTKIMHNLKCNQHLVISLKGTSLNSLWEEPPTWKQNRWVHEHGKVGMDIA